MKLSLERAHTRWCSAAVRLHSFRLALLLLTIVSAGYATPERATNPPGFDKGTPRDRSPQHPRAAPPRSSGDEGAPHRHGSSTPCAPEGLWGIQPRLYDLRQSLVASMQSIVFVGHEGDDQSDNAGLESDSDSEPPSFVYAKKKS